MASEANAKKKENKEALPLSYAQQRLWFMDRFNPNSSLYNIPTVWHLKRKLDT